MSTQPSPYNPSIRYSPIKVSTRTISFLDVATAAWGDEWAQPDHDIYVWSDGQSFDSTDMYNTGVYGYKGDPNDTILLNDNYPDMRNELFGNEGFNAGNQWGANWQVVDVQGNNVPGDE